MKISLPQRLPQAGFFRLFIAYLVLLVTLPGFTQVQPRINTGDPAFPFPQFLPYQGPNGHKLGNLATHNAPGVTHAEMEQRTREAWQLVCNNTSPYPGAVVSGVQYLYPTAPNHCTCVEGDGYYLLGAALMGDKEFFDGYYMWAHDRAFNGVKRFIDGEMNPYRNYSRGLSYAGSFGAGTDVYGGGIAGNSAADGDVDVGLALLIAYKQWGEHSGIILNHGGWNGKEINYKEEALRYIKAMVDTSVFPPALPEINHVTGIVGLDGYLKRGDSWGELTSWALSGYRGMRPQTSSSGAQYIDYNAPAWFYAFREFLEEEGEREFLIDQYKRAEASSDWLTGLHYSKDEKNIPYMGKVDYVAGDDDFRFSNYIPDGEDFRGPWRTIMNYVWHGNPNYTWNPNTHQVEDGVPNTFNYDMGTRYARFLKNQQGEPWNNPCMSVGDLKDHITFKGPYTLLNGYFPDGRINGGAFPLNWIHGTGAPSAIVAQDFDLMGEMFRHCVIAWDAATGTNLDSRPIYFHEWFRLAGMLTLAGNWHSPLHMNPTANLKVYHKVDKTYAFTGDQLTYTISYRNYGSVNAAGSVVKFGVPEGFEFVSATRGGALSGDSVIWNLGSIPGFKTDGLDATMDSMKVTLRIGPEASGNYCTSARIFCTNGSGWTSNEYPNNITSVMERNCVDVVKRALVIDKSSSRKEVNPATNGEVVYKIRFENSSDAGWINGGRPGVRFAFAHEEMEDPSKAAANVLKYRLYNDAVEPYIDYGNYRVSFFMNDPNIKCYTGDPGCTTGWSLMNTIAEGVDPARVKVLHENIVAGQNEDGAWNQRIVLQFTPQLATIAQHLQQYAGSPSMVHEGGTAILRGVWRLYTSNYSDVDWTDDWSYDDRMADGDGGIYNPIGDDYSDLHNPGLPINSWHRSACQTTDKIMKKVLVEEWDGYTWRRIMGNGPLPGRDISNVVIRDTLPAGVTIKNFIRQNPLGVEATTSLTPDGRVVITWMKDKLQINQKDSIVFTAVIAGTCPGEDQSLVNRVWISGDGESAISDADTLTVTCNKVTICPEPANLIQSSDKEVYSAGETVEYTINYTQTQGSIAYPDLNSATDWTVQSGSTSNVQFGDGKIILPGLNGAPAVVVTHDYSYGINTLGNGIEGTISPAISEGNGAIVVRHSGGASTNGVYVVLKTTGGSNPTTVDIYSGTTKLNSTSFSVPFSSTLYDFRIHLDGGTLSMWLVANGTEISGAPSIVQTGIPVRAGYAGFAHGVMPGEAGWGTHTVTSWRTHLDVAYDVEVLVPVPEEIGEPIQADNGGVYAQDTVRWILATGKSNPVPYGETWTLNWSGIYETCEKATSTAYVNTRGILQNTYGSCYEILCTSDCVLPDTVIVTGITVIEEGESTTLTAEITPEQSGFIYNWYKLPDLNTPLSQSGPDQISLTVSDTGRYVVRVVQPGNSLCFEESAIIRVVFDEICTLPDLVVIQGDLLLEAGSTTTLTADVTPAQTGWIYNWYKLPDMSNPLAGSGLEQTTLVVSDTGRYIVRLVNENDETCRILSEEVVVEYLCEKADVKVFLDGTELADPYTVQLCEGQTAVLSFSSQKYDFEFDLRQLPGAVLMDGVPVSAGNAHELTISSEDAGSWLLNVYADPGNQGNRLCWSIEDAKLITISETSAPAAVITSPEDFEYCEGSDGVTLIASSGTNYTYTWRKDGVVQANDPQSPTYANATEGIWKVIVAASVSCVDSSEVLVTELSRPVAEINAAASQSTYCAGTNGALLMATDAGLGATYLFLNNGVADGTFSMQNTKTVTSGLWSVVVELPGGCRDTSAVFEVEESSEIALVISGDTILCEGDALELTTNMGNVSGVRWTLPDLSVVTDAVVRLNDPQAGIYIVDYNDGSGCTGSAQVEVQIEPAVADPQISITGASFAACVGEVLEINTLVTNTVSPVYEWYVNDILQPGASSAVFSSSALSQGDWVKVLVKSDGSCRGELTAADSVMVTINELPEATLEADKMVICEGESVELQLISESTIVGAEWYRNSVPVSGTVSGFTVNAAGEYRVRITDNRGCIGEAEPIIIDMVSLPALTISGASSTICDGVSVQIEVSADQTDNYEYSWYRSGVLIPGASTRILTAQQAGTYYAEVALGECTTTSDNWTLTETLLAAPVINGEDSPVCEASGEVYSVAAPSATSSYLWTVPSGAVVTSNTGASIVVSFGTSDGAITVVETNAQGCVSPEATLAVALRYCDLKAGFTSDKTIVCAGDTVEFVNNSAGTSSASTYRWSFGAGAVPSQFLGEGPVKVVFNQAGLVDVSLTVEENNFSNRYDGSIEVLSRPVVQSIVGSDLLCIGIVETYTALSESAIQSLDWMLSNNLQQITSSGNAIHVQGTALGQGLLSVYITDINGCVSDVVEKNVSVVEQPVVSLTASKEVFCVNETVDLVATGGLFYDWYYNNQIIAGVSGSNHYRATQAGEYYVRTGSGACSDESERIIIQLSEVDVDAGPDHMINIGESVQLTTVTSGSVSSYYWEPGNVAPTASPTVSPAESTTYTVLVTDIYGCTASDEVHVKVVLPLFIPNAFTPNGDGVHDVWEVQGLERFADLKVEIYNRWGNLIYSSRGSYKPWDGKKNGEYMPVGTYYYVIDVGDEMKPLTGAILLSK